MKNVNLTSSLALAVALSAPNAFAVIIEGSFKGTVRDFVNGTDGTGYSGYWDNVSKGNAVSGSFWYDIAKAPEQHRSDFPTESQYASYTDSWMGSSFNIDGKSYNISALPILDRYAFPEESIRIVNHQPDVDGSTLELFSMHDVSNTDTVEGAFIFRWIQLSIDIYSQEKPLLNGLGIEQEFDWYDIGDPASYGEAYFALFDTGERKDSAAWIDINEFHLKVREKTTVTESSSLVLLLLGVLASFMKFGASLKRFS